MTTQIINNFNSLNSEDLSTVKGGACSFWGATAAVGVGAVGGAIKGGIQTGTWQGAALKGIGYGIKDGITYGLICRYQAITESIFGQIVLALLIYGLIFFAWQHFRGEIFSIVCIYVSISLADDVYHLAEEYVKKKVNQEYVPV